MDIPGKHSASDAVADSIVDALQFDCFPSSSDANIFYYVSGYIARSIVRSTRCDYCKDSAATFLDAVNRGGLARPTDFTFSVTVHCWRVFEEIKSQSCLVNFCTSRTNSLCSAR